MRCPSCSEDRDRVIDSRPALEGASIRRRRECQACGLRFTTFERIELPALLVRKSRGTCEPFDREKVREGVARAAQGRVSTEDIDRAVAAVETALRSNGIREVTSEQVGFEVLDQLRTLDQVAYVRFASVYKDFQGPEDFEKELKTLRKDGPTARAAV